MLFYQKPVQLNREAHRDLRLGALKDDFSFASATNSIPLAATEFFDAAREYPIVFSNHEAGAPFPVTLLGARRDENLFVSKGGKWEGAYVPAFVRRYPFVLSEQQGVAEFGVVVDEGYPGFGAADGERLFSDTGEHAPLLKQSIEFLAAFEAEMKRTRQFAECLQAHNLLIPRVLEVAHEGKPSTLLQGFSVIDEGRLMALADAQLVELARSGFLALAYAHLISLRNLPVLAARLNARLAADAAALVAPPDAGARPAPRRKR